MNEHSRFYAECINMDKSSKDSILDKVMFYVMQGIVGFMLAYSLVSVW